MALQVDDDDTSEILSEVPEDEEIGVVSDADYEDDVEHPVTQPDEVTLVLIEDARKFGAQFQSVNKEIHVWRPTIIALKDKFKVTKGCQGIRIVVYGHPMFWNEFCKTYFGVGARRVNQLINDSDKKDNRTVVTKPDSDKPLWKKGYTRAVEELTAKGMIVSSAADNLAEIKSAPKLDPAAPIAPIALKPTLDAKDPYAFFEQFESEPQTMASELATMLIGFDMDDTTLLAALKKELKAQRKELELAKAATAGD